MMSPARLAGRTSNGVPSRAGLAASRFRLFIAEMATVMAAGVVLVGCAAAPDAPMFTPAPDSAESPFHQFFDGVLVMSVTPSENAELRAASEDLIARCMSDAGFEYWPEVPDQLATTLTETSNIEDYGIWQNFDPDAPRGENDVYYDGLARAGQIEYSTAYWGPSGDGGCHAEAMAETGGDEEAITNQVLGGPEYAALAEAMELMSEQANVYFGSDRLDPRFSEINVAWSNCMARDGHGAYQRPNEVQAALWDQYEFAAADAPLDAVELRVLKDSETTLFSADARCRASVDYESRVKEVRAAVELEFIRGNEAELRRLRDDLVLAAGEGSP
ncbi:hypothetical protein [Cellulomonas sp. HD19AZ1]|uniref:hypothetical protein n=1 Tax=Cellulomonas sp. HD19AZ1 TaxID=2559593 RepID=UPI001070FDA5|nr:hypothetical protein [Cellulomonas sp. HD19AZ1]TFH71171.1 hypothetical protein E4A51_10005 [Cellulomonas sp. HD19AZ1]